jgi:hypothetical protein
MIGHMSEKSKIIDGADKENYEILYENRIHLLHAKS